MATRVKSTSSAPRPREAEARSSEAVAVGAVPPDYVEKNRAAWDRWALHYTATGRKAWTETELRWGIWGVAESELGLLKSLPAGADVIELGCGTASVSSWVARAGFRPVAVDVSRKQLDVAAVLTTGARPVIPADPRERRGRAVRRRELRPRDLRVRREPLVRAASLARRGRPSPSAGRSAHLRHEQPAAHGVHARGR